MEAAFFIVVWDVGSTEIHGPFESFETAEDIAKEDHAGEAACIVGPLPMRPVSGGSTATSEA